MLDLCVRLCVLFVLTLADAPEWRKNDWLDPTVRQMWIYCVIVNINRKGI